MDKRIIERLTDARLVLFSAVGLGFLSTALLLVQASALARLVNASFMLHRSIRALLPAMSVLFAVIVLRGVLAWLSRVTCTRLSLRLKTSLRAELLKHLMELGPAFMKGERTGELVQTAFEGIEQLEGYVSNYVPQLALAAIAPMMVWLFVACRDSLSALTLCIAAPLIPLFMILIGKSAQAVTDRQWHLMGTLGGHFLDVLKGLPTLRMFQRCDAQEDIIHRMTDEYRKATMKPLRIAFLSSFVMELLTTLGTAMVAVGLGLRLLSGHIGFETAFVILLLVPEFFLPIRVLGTQYHASMNGITAARRIFEVLDQPLPGENAGTILPAAAASGRMEFRNVSFAYPGSTRLAIEHVSFAVEPGEMVAIVGPSGAGKSTLVDLVLGFLRPVEGEILVDGCPLAHLSNRWWRAQVAHVPQHPYLFAGSIRDNVCLGQVPSEPSAVEHATRLACAHSFITQLPDGYETRLDEGGQRLSGGQAQRIAIARALLKGSPILIFDEPTAHLDVETEAAMRRVFDTMRGRKTVLVVAHRLSTILRANRILVMDSGRIAEQGTHAELLRLGGLYSRMVKAYERGAV